MRLRVVRVRGVDTDTRPQLLGRAEEAREKLGAGALRDMLSVWSGIIQQCSVPEMEWTFRLAVARSIHASGICDYKPGTQKLGTCPPARAFHRTRTRTHHHRPRTTHA